MNKVEGLDTSLELDYVITLPSNQASIFRKELMKKGVPNSSIKIVKSIESEFSIDKYVNNNHRTRPRVKFMPTFVKLGTYGDGEYNVLMRRRTSPDARETVWITLASNAYGASSNTSNQPSCDGDQIDNAVNKKENVAISMTVNEICNHEGLMINNCQCRSNTCFEYREALIKYFSSYDANCTECLFKKIADSLLTNYDNESIQESEFVNDSNMCHLSLTEIKERDFVESEIIHKENLTNDQAALEIEEYSSITSKEVSKEKSTDIRLKGLSSGESNTTFSTLCESNIEVSNVVEGCDENQSNSTPQSTEINNELQTNKELPIDNEKVLRQLNVKPVKRSFFSGLFNKKKKKEKKINLKNSQKQSL
ncbi:uncharacterized protein LOC126898379 [Daktulosphaira vitifoliae]|uniref:uncharacterized protein LOC126898379 n=1 Tax=Daktulosphaira vitifoliae TaxID=58002 RepID=UPI0021AA09CC|nr:uncharacterized protein LOC126898379 [Daktulosphaira vitifoliae]XP_050528311.1 uncharacterized protein LOC126898379 [Daktulosphaira vitifoliae]XP_050528312.1 uncharacterized protein LOC126898379 [Daktulosphaira vitifoliae]